MSRRFLIAPSPNIALPPSGAPQAPAWRSWVESASRRWLVPRRGRASAGHNDITRLMAALYADMAGYSRLFALDDIGTVARLRTLHQDLVAPAISRHHGRLVQTGGDSMLIIFESVAQAVQCAVAIQLATARDDDDGPHDRRMRFRIGVDLGDIIMDGMNFHGDGVIVATRLQAVCPPGGICVSRAVHERGGDRLGLPTQVLGPLALKNVARPVEAFVLWPGRQESAKLAG
jgi:adenylate cyclase